MNPALQGLNPYVYCGNNPVMFVDPNGEFFFTFLCALIPGLQPLVITAAFVEMSMMQGGMQSVAQGGSFLEGAGKGFLTGAITAGSSFLNVPGMLPNGLLHAGGNVLLNGITNSIYGQNFWKGAALQAAAGFLAGANSGFRLAADEGVNVWTGRGSKKIVASSDIPIVGQEGAANCLPAATEAMSSSLGGDLDQNSLRQWYGGDADIDYIPEGEYWSRFLDERGEMHNYEFNMATMAEGDELSIANYMNEGYAVSLNVKASAKLHHKVVAHTVYQQKVKPIFGKWKSKLTLKVMDPSHGGSYRIINPRSLSTPYLMMIR